jgi:hypothetical protein
MMQESASAKKTHGDRVMADALTLDDKEIPKPKFDKKTPPVNSAGHRFLAHIKNRKYKRMSRSRAFDFSMV